MVKDKICITMDRDLVMYLRELARSRRPKVSLSHIIEYYVRLGIEYEKKYLGKPSVTV